MTSHGHHDEHEVKGSADYDPKFGRGTIIGIGIFVILLSLALAYTDNWLKANKTPGTPPHASEPAPQH
ncbi:MAG: hypothetical protein QHH02_05235 [Syntrophomonadaceae bacterium]|nr:hypothetical protein [Syntrophomonadaceae bacterium]